MTQLGDEGIPHSDHTKEDLGGEGLGAGDRGDSIVLATACEGAVKAGTKGRRDSVKNRVPGERREYGGTRAERERFAAA